VSLPHQCECRICGRAMEPFFRQPLLTTEPRYCVCADPENCTQAVPGLICKAGHTIDGLEKHEP
jgi:hypothetical protein